MKLLDILMKVGGAVVKTAVPGGGLIVDMVNELLPAGHKLPADVSGDGMRAAIGALPPDQQASIMEKEFDVEITQIKESNATVRAMLESDAKNPHSTRPYIARGSFHVVAFAVIVAISVWAYGVFTDNSELVKSVMDGWQFVLAVIGPLVTLLWAYFGVLKQEHKNRLDAAGGSSTPSGLAGIISSMLKR